MSKARTFVGEFIRISQYSITLRDGSKALKDRVEHPDSVVILANPTPSQVILVHQFRPVIGCHLWELPAGKMLADETPRRAALRELKEETGYGARSIRRILRFFPAPGVLTECLHLYRATGLKAGRTRMDPDEDMTTHVLDRRSVKRMVDSGEILDGKSLIGLNVWFRAGRTST